MGVIVIIPPITHHDHSRPAIDGIHVILDKVGETVAQIGAVVAGGHPDQHLVDRFVGLASDKIG